MVDVTPKMIAAAWSTWRSRHGDKLGPGPAFREAIEAALNAQEMSSHPQPHFLVIPEGWSLAPIEPTLDMVMAGEEAWERGLEARLDAKPRIEYPSEETVELAARVAYRAMIISAPTLEKSPSPSPNTTGDEREAFIDKIEGLEADLDSAVEVAFKRGATEWCRMNYPAHFARLTAATTEGKP